jgi:metal-responsive CopG/Arc/MetJ family transcriptional regulator
MRMRTTVTLDEDVAAAIEGIRRQDGTGVSEAINRLIRAGLVQQPRPEAYRHQTSDIGLKMDVSNIGEVLDLLDET